jgi:hypothetical protein
MPEPILNRSRVMACIGQGIAAGVPQHVHVNLEGKAGTLTDAFDQAIDGIGCNGSAALRLEYIPAAGLSCSSRRARSSSPRIGWAAGLPFLARRTCKVAARSNSTCDHSRSHNSTARSPCRYATRIRVASRCPWRPLRAVLISVSTSDGVRYSRGRKSLLLGRVGVWRRVRTDRFSLFGWTNCKCAVIGFFPRPFCRLTGQGALSGKLLSGWRGKC